MAGRSARGQVSAVRSGIVGLCVTSMVAALGLAAMPASAESGSAQSRSAPVARASESPATGATLFVWASVGPNTPLDGALVVVRDRDQQLIASGTANREGVVMLTDLMLTEASLPLTLTTSGGVARGKDFEGNLKAYAWPALTETTTIYLDLVSTAATRKEVLTKDGLPTQRAWNTSVDKIREAVGIPADAPANILRFRNNYVDVDRILAAARADRPRLPSTFNGLMGVLAKEAAAGREVARLAPRGSVSAGASAKLRATDVNTAVCSSAIPNSPAPGTSSTEIITQVGLIATQSLLQYSGVPDAAATGIPGMVFAGLGGSGSVAPDQSALIAVMEQLNCISSQVNALQVAAQNQALATAMAAANECRDQITLPWGNYVNLMAAAQPNVVGGATGVAGSSNVTLPGALGYSNIEGSAVSGDGIGSVNLSVPDATGIAGDYTLTLPGNSGKSPSPTIGMTVTGTGIGGDGEAPVTVQDVDTVGGSIVVSLSAANTGRVDGAIFTDVVKVLSSRAVSGNTVVTLSGENSGDINGSLTFTMILDKNNPQLTQYAQDWKAVKTLCGSKINSALFVPAAPGVKSGWQQIVTNAYTLYNGEAVAANSVDQADVQSLQQFLAYWSSVLYQQFVLTTESNNFYFGQGDMTNAQESGAAPGSDGLLCAENALDTYCAWNSNIAAAVPPNLYSDEAGLIGGGVAVSSVPMGMATVVTNCSGGKPAPTGLTGVTAYWFACQTNSASKSYTDFPAVQGSAIDYANSLPLNTSSANTAVQTWKSPRTRYTLPFPATNGWFAWDSRLSTKLGDSARAASDPAFANQILAFYAASATPRYTAVPGLIAFGDLDDLTWPTKSAGPNECPCAMQMLGRSWWEGASTATEFLPPPPPTPSNPTRSLPDVTGVKEGN